MIEERKAVKFAKRVRKKKKIEERVKEISLPPEEEKALLEGLEVMRQLRLAGWM